MMRDMHPMLRKFKSWFGRTAPASVLQFSTQPVTLQGITYQLKKAAEPDVPEMLAVERRIYAGRQPWDARAFHSELRRYDKALYLNAYQNGHLVAYIGTWFTPREAHVTNLAVDPDWQQRGLGRFLLETMIERARAAGTPRVTLEVRVDNMPAIALYHSVGFRDGAIKPNYYIADQMDARNMILDLPAEKESD
ncbi:ribosomal-protein-alanine N-acetyltransferase [Schleiferilactobacillus shenzhenensis LY-73]|uniref:Ribosomal-protein-alanine N-acetyltransferase n=2 Tax=Schleiferilactobacillus shenzhenensis TaxID=1231337 RepID=U4TWY5_9LACO|nr:ribosomal-protein-alanine N-acetyltransferase [Schleiferilactobacillus shenzhenensis LY-73]